jgi:Ca2+-binding RTX toxin-like protein
MSLSLSYGGAGNDRLAGAVFEDELYGEDGGDVLVACGAAGAMAVAATIA